MRITQSHTFWAVLVTAVLSFLVGQIHYILGWLFFFLMLRHVLYPAVLIDIAYGALEYHHDRNDARTKKEMESWMYIERWKQKLKLKQ